METVFHIITKVSSVKVSASPCPVALVLKDHNKKENIKIDLDINAEKNHVFHSLHRTAVIQHIDAVDFFLVSGSTDDAVLLDSIEIINMNTKRLQYFPCREWINSISSQETSQLADTGKIQKKRNCFEIFKGRDRLWHFRLRAGNCEIVAQSEGYTTRAGALHGIASIKAIIPLAVTTYVRA